MDLTLGPPRRYAAPIPSHRRSPGRTQQTRHNQRPQIIPGGVAAAVSPYGVGALDALRVDDPGRGLGVATGLQPYLFPQLLQDAFGDRAFLPKEF